MTNPLQQKIAGLKARYQSESTMPPSEALDLLEVLRQLHDEVVATLAVATEAQVRVDARLNAVERLASTYQEPRG